MKKLLLFLGLTFCFAAAQQGDIYYEIFVRSFQDSGNDGVGDFNGVTERLDYLVDLGVTGVWLMPVHPSPSYHGYDVTDYYDVNPDYGTLAEFETLLDEAHARDIKIIIDLVVNHSSSDHPWFKSARAGDETYRDFYSWRDTDPGWRGTSGAPAWHSTNSGYYLGLFWSGMPDLNLANPEVVTEIESVAKFWLDLGVDGFRVDAIQHIFESPDGNIRNVPETFDWVRDFEAFIKTVNPAAFVVGETWTDSGTIVKYHNAANLDMSFNYPLWDAILTGISSRSAGDLGFMLVQDETLYPEAALRATFVSNHDQVRPATTLGALRRDEARIKLAGALLLTLPGTPFIYYGEELGLPNGPGELDEEKRTPMPWDNTEGFGFSEAAPWYAFSSTDPTLTAAVQRDDPDSVLNSYKTFIALRKNSSALTEGATEVLDTDERALLAVVRESGEQRLLVLANMGAKALEYDLSFTNGTALDLLSGEGVEGSVAVDGLGVRVLELP